MWLLLHFQFASCSQLLLISCTLAIQAVWLEHEHLEFVQPADLDYRWIYPNISLNTTDDQIPTLGRLNLEKLALRNCSPEITWHDMTWHDIPLGVPRFLRPTPLQAVREGHPLTSRLGPSLSQCVTRRQQKWHCKSPSLGDQKNKETMYKCWDFHMGSVWKYDVLPLNCHKFHCLITISPIIVASFWGDPPLNPLTDKPVLPCLTTTTTRYFAENKRDLWRCEFGVLKLFLI